MKELTRKFLEKAARSIASAETLLANGHLEAAASQAYYAMFHVAQGLLDEQELTFRKHGGVHGAFGVHFAKTGLLDPRYHRWLLDAFDKRLAADYGAEVQTTAAEVREMLAQAREFLDSAEQFLQRQ